MSRFRLAQFGLMIGLVASIASCADSSRNESPSNGAGEADGAGEAAASEAALPVAFHNPLTSEQIADGWISLFDGRTLYGWESNDESINWRVADGVITADAGPTGLLHTTVPFADYELKCDFRFAPGGNSGLFLRTLPQPQDVQRDCYELNLADTHPEGYTTGSFVALKKTSEPILASGQWHTFHATLEGNHSTVQLDGELVLDFIDERAHRLTSGLIGLQHREGQVEFRNVRLKPLGMTDLFNGSDLTGWREVPGSESAFGVEDGTIHVTNGPGFLESEETFGDFILQADAIVHGDALNSGIFFRAMPGTEDAPSNGYEMQIHNGITDGDPTRPDNAGTGAIFRRTEARRVVSRDHEWFTTTLVASGPRIAVWIDGYQVTNWEDPRPPHENPRQGRRLDPGHISLQGHDPTTNLAFRNLKIAQLPQR